MCAQTLGLTEVYLGDGMQLYPCFPHTSVSGEDCVSYRNLTPQETYLPLHDTSQQPEPPCRASWMCREQFTAESRMLENILQAASRAVLWEV